MDKKWELSSDGTHIKVYRIEHDSGDSMKLVHYVAKDTYKVFYGAFVGEGGTADEALVRCARAMYDEHLRVESALESMCAKMNPKTVKKIELQKSPF